MVKNLPANAGDEGLILGSGRSPGEENGKPLQYSCLGNLMYRRVWEATVHGAAKSRTWLSDFDYHFHINTKNHIPGNKSTGKRPPLWKLLKEIKDNTDGKIYNVLELEKKNIVKLLYYPRQFTDSMQ